jgi:hypothetical protein
MKFMGMEKRLRRLLIGCAAGVALSLPAHRVADAQENTGSGGVKLGSELDILPYATGGYYGSGFLGRDGWKFRYVVARTDIPSFLVTDGFEAKRTDAYALLADRFFGAKRGKLEGFWIGGGGEYWRSRIRTDASPAYTSYQNYLLTLGGGYVWRLSKHFYLNPWAGGHFVVAHARAIAVSAEMYTQPVFTAEASAKLGITF